MAPLVYTPATHIAKEPDEAFGAAMSFEHRGPAETVWVGIGMAYGKGLGHNVPFCYAVVQVDVANDDDWTPYEASPDGVVPGDVLLGELCDSLKFVTDTEPNTVDQVRNPYGVNNWDDDNYWIKNGDEPPPPPPPPPDGGDAMTDMIGMMIPMMMMVMMMNMMTGMFGGEEGVEEESMAQRVRWR